MNLSISNIAWNAEDDDKVYNKMRQLGFKFLEIAPTRWVLKDPYSYHNILIAKSKSEKLYKEYGIKIASMQSILYGINDRLFKNTKERNNLKEKVKEAICYAREINCNNIVFGSPKNRIIENRDEQFEIGIEFFKELSEYSEKNNVFLSIEPNPIIYNTNYINTTEEALKLVKKVDNKYFGVNYDVGTVIYNNENINIIEKNLEKINHIHISEENLNPIKERDLHKKLYDILRKNNYKKIISIEMKNNNNIDKLFLIMEYVSKIFI